MLMTLRYSKKISKYLFSISDFPIEKKFDFLEMTCEELLEFNIDLEFVINKPSLMHGISCWFDTYFEGSTQKVVLSTSPHSHPTHWYQVRLLLLPEPLAIKIRAKKYMAN